MRQQPSFDTYAADYDDHFTHSAIGQAQRRQVWRYLTPYLNKPLRILEINCGTGVDAIKLANMGHKVTATDASAEMIRVCETKKSAELVTFKQVSFHDLGTVLKGEKYDLIFSNFGGLNCLSGDKTEKLAAIFSDLLKADGYLFLNYMSKNCWWEQGYYRWKGQPDEATRRRRSPLKVKVGNAAMDVWYYTPAELTDLFAPYFQIKEKRPVGLFVPPSYLEHYFGKRRQLLNLLEQMDRFFSFPIFADRADHFVLVLKKATI